MATLRERRAKGGGAKPGGTKPAPKPPKNDKKAKNGGGGSPIPSKGHIFDLESCTWVQITMPDSTDDHDWTVEIFPYPGSEFGGKVHVLVSPPKADGTPPDYQPATPGDPVPEGGSTVKRKVKKGEVIYLHYTAPKKPGDIKVDVSAK